MVSMINYVLYRVPDEQPAPSDPITDNENIHCGLSSQYNIISAEYNIASLKYNTM